MILLRLLPSSKVISQHSNQLQQRGLRPPVLVCRRWLLLLRCLGIIGRGRLVIGKVGGQADYADGFGWENASCALVRWGEAAWEIGEVLAPAKSLQLSSVAS